MRHASAVVIKRTYGAIAASAVTTHVFSMWLVNTWSCEKSYEKWGHEWKKFKKC